MRPVVEVGSFVRAYRCHGYSTALRVRETQVQIPALSLASCVTLGTSLSLAELQSLYL